MEEPTNSVTWHNADKKDPPANLRIITVDMKRSAPVFVDNIFQENGRFLTNNSSPTHWTYSLNFPIM